MPRFPRNGRLVRGARQVGGGPFPWTPATPGTGVTPLHWFRADLGVTQAGGKASALADQVGAMHQSQATANLQPAVVAADAGFGNKAVLSFAGSTSGAGHLLGAAVSSIPTPVSIFLVMSVGGSSRSFVSVPMTVYDMLWVTTSNQVEFFANKASDFRTGSGILAANTAVCVLYTDDGVNSYIYINNLTVPAATMASTTWTNTTLMNIGKGEAGVPDNNGKFAELAMWSGVPDASYRAQMASYVTSRYGL